MKAIIYLVGTIVLLAGILYGMNVAGVPQKWIIVTGLIIGGLGIMGAAKEHLSSSKVSKTTTDSSGNTTHSETEVKADTLS